MRKWDRELEQWDWEQEYPKVPEAFHKALLKEVERHCSREEWEQLLMTEQNDGRNMRNKDRQREGQREGQRSGEFYWRDEGKRNSQKDRLDRGQKRRKGRRMGKFLWLFLPAAVLLLGLSVLAEKSFYRKRWNEWEEVREDTSSPLINIFYKTLEEETALGMIQEKPKVTYTNEGETEENPEEGVAGEKEEDLTFTAPPVLEIKEVLFDGDFLYVYGEPTEKGKQYCLKVEEIRINGKNAEFSAKKPVLQYGSDRSAVVHSEAQIPTVFILDGKRKEAAGDLMISADGYGFCFDLRSFSVTKDFQATLSLKVREAGQYQGKGEISGSYLEGWGDRAYQKQNVAIEVKASEAPKVIRAQAFEYEAFCLALTEGTVSVSGFSGEFHLYMNEEQQKTYLEYPHPGKHYRMELVNEKGEVYLEWRVRASLESISKGVIFSPQWPDVSLDDRQFTIRILEEKLGYGGTVTGEKLYGESAVELPYDTSLLRNQ